MTAQLVQHLLDASAERLPDAVAVVDGERSITYRQLVEEANRLGRVLIENGVRKGDRVGLFLEKSIEAVTGIYGVLKAGATYVPFDPHSPVGRLGLIAHDAGIRCLVTARDKQPAWEPLVRAGAPVEALVVLDADAGEIDDAPAAVRSVTREALKAQSAEPISVGLDEPDLAYILYTSGSTGMPKGVMLSHRNARAFVDWAAGEFAVTADDRLSSHAPLHFDLSVFDLFAASSGGAAVVLVPPGLSVFPLELGRFVEAQEISVWYSVPSALTMLVLRGQLEKRDLAALRTVLFAGEVFPTKYLIQAMDLVPHARFCNLYGPTETNVCTWYEVERAELDPARTIPIGRPITGVEVVVTAESGEAVPVGDVGELLVRGPTVMQGYWGDPERTERVLVDADGGRAYRTGDLVQQSPDGNLLFLGRRDAQVKSRGYRIELGEVEAALNSHPLVVECAVVPVPDDVLTNTLRAHVVAHDGLTEADLASFCSDRLPRYMLPERFDFRPALPKSSTGKIDRRALAALDDGAED